MTSQPRHQVFFFIFLILFSVGTTEASKIPRPAWRTRFLQKINYASREGLTGDPCTSSSECVSPRICRTTEEECASSSSGCFCVSASGLEQCTASSDCVSGEGCVEGSESQFCVSCDIIESSDSLSLVDDGSTCSSSEEGNDGDNDDGDSSSGGDEDDSDNGGGTGLTGDPCTSSSECVSPRICRTTEEECSSSSSGCFCVPASGLEQCTASSDCVSGEGCVEGSESQFCVSCYIIESSDSLSLADDGSTCSSSEEGNDGDNDDGDSSSGGDEDDSDNGGGTGLTGDPCTSSSECVSPRICRTTEEECSSSSSGCFCVPASGLEQCTASSDCVSGEGCVEGSESQFCVSCYIIESSDSLSLVDDGSTCSGTNESGVNEDSSSSDDNGDSSEDEEADNENEDNNDDDENDDNDNGEDNDDDDDDSDEDGEGDGEDDSDISTGGSDDDNDDDTNGDDNDDDQSTVCLSVRHLKQLKSTELVFAEHRRASVLCDSHGSCATPGHIIVYQSEAMTMSRYCTKLSDSCHKRVTLVNSPRMQYGLRVNSFTEGLEFTPLAAKYETKLEEAVLKVLVRFGM